MPWLVDFGVLRKWDAGLIGWGWIIEVLTLKYSGILGFKLSWGSVIEGRWKHRTSIRFRSEGLEIERWRHALHMQVERQRGATWRRGRTGE